MQEMCHHPATRREERDFVVLKYEPRDEWAGEAAKTGRLWPTGGGSRGNWIQGSLDDLIRSQASQARLPSLSVGPPVDRRDIKQPTGSSLPTLVPKTELVWNRGVFTEVIGRVLPQIKEVLPVQKSPIAIPLPQVRTGPVPTGAGPQNVNIGTNSMPSVTDFLRDIIPGSGDIFNTGAGLIDYFSAPGQVAPPAVMAPAAPTVVQGGGGGIVPPVDMGGGACDSDPRNNYVLKFSCGQWKWVKKQKRRRKRLATSSDIKDLSSLKGVLGGGKILETWIATHG